MVPRGVEVAHRHPSSVCVLVASGPGTPPPTSPHISPSEAEPRQTFRATHPLWPADISNEAFVEAVAQAIAKARLFKAVLKSEDADYRLEVAIIRLDQIPSVVGMVINEQTITVELAAEWKLTRVSDGRVVFRDVVSKSYTATTGYAFWSDAKQVRLATEGAARENIEAGIVRLSRLNLSTPKEPADNPALGPHGGGTNTVRQ
jgi:hypothetical protein